MNMNNTKLLNYRRWGCLNYVWYVGK